jgi:oxaloacetate decarboxylase gamma subunit
MQDSLLEQGIELMIYGMGTVFVFLAVLVVATTLMSSLMQRYIKPVVVEAPKAVSRPSAAAASDTQLMAVISAAIHKHRSTKRK